MKINQLTDTTLLGTRVVLGTIIAAHGAQKLFGWFGGFGFEGTMGFFTGTIGLPYILALLIVVLESVGMIALFFGIASRILAAALIAVMLGAIVTSHSHHFFMNWFGNQAGEGYEYHLLVIALASVLTLNGSGAYSIDRYLARHFAFRNRAAKVLFS